MSFHCCILSCSKSEKDNDESGAPITLHSFPRSKNLRDRWVTFTRRMNFTPNSHSRLCSRHFVDQDYEKNGKCLRPSAIPSKFFFEPGLDMHFSTNLAPKSKQNKQFQTGILEKSMQTSTLTQDPRYANLKRKVKTLQMQQRRLRIKVKELKAQSVAKEGTLEVFQFLESTFQDLPILPLLKNHFANMGVKNNQRRFSEEVREFSIVLYSHSKKAYGYMQNFLNLPTKVMVEKWINEKDFDGDDSQDFSSFVTDHKYSVDDHTFPIDD